MRQMTKSESEAPPTVSFQAVSVININAITGIYYIWEGGGVQGFPTPDIDFPSLDFLKCIYMCT